MNKMDAIKKATGQHWMEHAVKHPGSFKKAAAAAGKSVHALAEEKKNSAGTLGRRARLALTFEKMRQKKG